jgi:hypothetical protein
MIGTEMHPSHGMGEKEQPPSAQLESIRTDEYVASIASLVRRARFEYEFVPNANACGRNA